jgi:hypothetical protein
LTDSEVNAISVVEIVSRTDTEATKTSVDLSWKRLSTEEEVFSFNHQRRFQFAASEDGDG